MLNSILIALDCSPDSDTVLKALDSLRLSAKAKLVLCHIFPPDNEDLPDPDRPHRFSSERYKEAKKQLESYQKKIPHSEIEIIGGEAVEEILRLANIYHAELIILGTRGLKGVERILKNSVSGQVVAEASCSVLVVHPDQEQKRVG
jgi:nucleotide-binding universal stress UspA family protein